MNCLIAHNVEMWVVQDWLTDTGQEVGQETGTHEVIGMRISVCKDVCVPPTRQPDREVQPQAAHMPKPL